MVIKFVSPFSILFKPENIEEEERAKHVVGAKPIPGSLYSKVRDSAYVRLILGVSLDMANQQIRISDEPTSEIFRDYQVKDIDFMTTHRAVLNANEMGLGKTGEAIETARLQRVDSWLIVAPKGTHRGWMKEIKKFWPDCPLTIKLNPRGILKKGIIAIYNYEKFLEKKNLERVKDFVWKLLTVDEVHKIKNAKSKRSRNVGDIPCFYRQGLSGTPILKRPDDLWHILYWLDPFFAGESYWDFVFSFCEIEENEYGRRPVGLTTDEFMQDILRQLLSHIMVRNLKKDVLKELPDKQIQVIELEMTREQKKLYRDAAKLAIEELPENCTVFNAASQFVRLQQIASNPQLFIETANPKFEFILSILEDTDQKILVYSRFRETIEKLNKLLLEHSINFATYHGHLNDSQRDSMKERFIKESQCRLLTATISAIGEGVDGLQDVCSMEIFIDRDPSPKMNEQAEDRLHRIGQKSSVNVMILKIPGTIDEHIEGIEEKKNLDIRKVLDYEDPSV
jgi:SNF2 family DNA or RNA helicase